MPAESVHEDEPGTEAPDDRNTMGMITRGRCAGALGTAEALGALPEQPCAIPVWKGGRNPMSKVHTRPGRQRIGLTTTWCRCWWPSTA